MKSPERLVQKVTINPYADRESLKTNSRKFQKVISIKINENLYTKLMAESEKKAIVMAELIRESIDKFLQEPYQSYDARFIINNTQPISFVIDVKTNKALDDFKKNNGINKSTQIRQALSGRYVKKSKGVYET